MAQPKVWGVAINQAKPQSERLVQVAKLFVQRKLEPWPEFLAALIIGSVAHDEARPNSDVDCLFVFEQLDERIVPAEFVWQPDSNAINTIFEVEANEVGGVQIDASGRRLSLEQFAAAEWEEGFKHDLSKAIILFDRHGSVEALMIEKLCYPDSLRVERINSHFVKAEYYLELWRLRTWITRGGLACAHDQLTAAFEELIGLLHAYNSVWLPWRYRRLASVQKLSWLPRSFVANMQNAIANGLLSEGDLARRREALRLILNSIVEKLQEDGFTTEGAGAFSSEYQNLGYAHNMEAWRSAHQEILLQRGLSSG